MVEGTSPLNHSCTLMGTNEVCSLLTAVAGGGTRVLALEHRRPWLRKLFSWLGRRSRRAI
jgi:hypothetical protein